MQKQSIQHKKDNAGVVNSSVTSFYADECNEMLFGQSPVGELAYNKSINNSNLQSSVVNNR